MIRIMTASLMAVIRPYLLAAAAAGLVALFFVHGGWVSAAKEEARQEERQRWKDKIAEVRQESDRLKSEADDRIRVLDAQLAEARGNVRVIQTETRVERDAHYATPGTNDTVCLTFDRVREVERGLARIGRAAGETSGGTGGLPREPVPAGQVSGRVPATQGGGGVPGGAES